MSSDLFRFETHVDPETIRARTLVVTLGSFGDAGHTQRLIDHTLMNGLESHQIGHFEIDELLDYRAHRPDILFQRDRLTQYSAPRMALHQLKDAEGTPFLLLSGPEPALRWEKLAATIVALVARLGVELTVLAQGVPMPTPHTRPMHLTRYASDSALIPGNEPIFDTMRMSASFPTMLTVRLGDAGHDVVGLTAHVPHYVTDSDYPESALAVLKDLRELTGLQLPSGMLPVAAGVIRAQLASELERSEEAREMVTELEQQYDEFTRQRRELAAAADLPDPADLPDADEIGREAEEFLRGLQEPGTDES